MRSLKFFPRWSGESIRDSSPRLLLSVTRRTIFSTSNVQPRCLVERSFNGFTLSNRARTSSGVATIVSGVRPSPDAATSANWPRGIVPEPWLSTNVAAPGTGALRSRVSTIAIRASGGMRLSAMWQPTQGLPCFCQPLRYRPFQNRGPRQCRVDARRRKLEYSVSGFRS